MKIIIDGCEIEIKAKSAGKNQYNKTDTNVRVKYIIYFSA